MVLEKKGEKLNSNKNPKKPSNPIIQKKTSEIQNNNSQKKNYLIKSKKNMQNNRLGSFMQGPNIFQIVNKKNTKNNKRKDLIEKIQNQFFKNKQISVKVASSDSDDSYISNSEDSNIDKNSPELFIQSKKKKIENKNGKDKKGENLNDMKTDETINEKKNGFFEKNKKEENQNTKNEKNFFLEIKENTKKNKYNNLSEVNIINLIEKNGGILIESEEEIHTPELPQSYFPKNPKLKNILELIKTKTEKIYKKEKLNLETSEDLLEKQKLNIVQDFLEEENDFEHIELVKDYLEDLHIKISNLDDFEKFSENLKEDFHENLEDCKDKDFKKKNDNFFENEDNFENLKHSFLDIKPFKGKKSDEDKGIIFKEEKNEVSYINKNKECKINVYHSFFEFKPKDFKSDLTKENKKLDLNCQKKNKENNSSENYPKKGKEEIMEVKKEKSQKINDKNIKKAQSKKKMTITKKKFLKQLIIPDNQDEEKILKKEKIKNLEKDDEKELQKEIWKIYKENYSVLMMEQMNKILNKEENDKSKKVNDLMKNMVSIDFIKYVINFEDEDIEKIVYIQRFWRRKTNSLIIRKISSGNMYFMKQSVKNKNRFSNFGSKK